MSSLQRTNCRIAVFSVVLLNAVCLFPPQAKTQQLDGGPDEKVSLALSDKPQIEFTLGEDGVSSLAFSPDALFLSPETFTDTCASGMSNRGRKCGMGKCP